MPATNVIGSDVELAVGANIRTRREQADLSQADLADRLTALGVDAPNQAYVAALEAGRRRPRLADLAACCAALGCPLDDLLEGTGWVQAAVAGQWQPNEDYLEHLQRAGEDRESADLARRLVKAMEKYGITDLDAAGLQAWVLDTYGTGLAQLREEIADRQGVADRRIARQMATKALLGAIVMNYSIEEGQF